MKRNKFIFILQFILLLSCNNSDKELFNGYIASINMNKLSQDSFDKIFEKIEIVSLETKEKSLIGNFKQFFYAEKYLFFLDKNLQIQLFDNEGNYISNSSKVMGNGPGEYHTALDVVYNHLKNRIEILLPYNEINVYDTEFNFIEKINIEIENLKMIRKFYPVSENLYLIVPSTLFEEYNTLYFYDIKDQTVVNKITYSDIYSAVTQTDVSVRYTNKTYYFNPIVNTYTGYEIDIETLCINPVIKLDFGKEQINKNVLDKFKTEEEKGTYLVEKSSYPLPTRILFNDKYILSIIIKERKQYTFFHNRTTKEDYLVRNDPSKGLHLPEFIAIDDDILYSVIQPYEIEKYIDSVFLDEKDKIMIKEIKEDDNPIVVKYYLNM